MPTAGGHHVADRRRRLHHAERVRPGPRRHDLGHQRHADPELAAHAEPAEEAVDVEVPNAGREDAQAGEERVRQDRDHHRLGAADAVAEDPEEHAADAPNRS